MKLNLWKIMIAIFLIIFFAPFILSALELQGIDESVETSQALNDIKEGEVSEVEVENEKFILTYNDETKKVAIKEWPLN